MAAYNYSDKVITTYMPREYGLTMTLLHFKGYKLKRFGITGLYRNILSFKYSCQSLKSFELSSIVLG